MLTSRRSGFAKRSGISSLIGAIFFVLVVFLVFSSTVLIFETFTNYGVTFKQVNQQDLNNKNTVIGVQDLAFGGIATAPLDETLGASQNVDLQPFLPVQNMNFTNSMTGWTFSRGYKLSLHDGQVTNYPKNVLPGVDVFTMMVTNLDTAGAYPLGTVITGVTMIVNSAFKVTPTTQPPSPAGWTLVSPTPTCALNCNVITWAANDVPPDCSLGIDSLPSSGTTTFNWAALLPAVDATYPSDVTLTWEVVSAAPNCSPVRDQGTATLSTTVVPSNQGGVDTEHIASEPGDTIPGGSFGGFDSISNSIGSESGPDSGYLSFQPTFNGNPIGTTIQSGVVVPEQLTSVMNFTTFFNLDSPLPLAPESSCAGLPVNCPSLSFGYGLDHEVSGQPALIFISAYLDYLPTDGVKQIINETAVNVSNNGWIMNNTKFSLNTSGSNPVTNVANTLMAGQYELVISVRATMFGSTPPSANYPASLLMHFDDMGLGFQEVSTSYCVDSSATVAGQPCASANLPAKPLYATILGAPLTNGVTTGPTSPNVLQYAAATWSVNQWVGDYLTYTSGPARGQTLPIASNTANSITTAGSFFPVPTLGGGDGFQVSPPLEPSQMRSLTFDAQLSVSTPGTEVTAYAYLEDTQASVSGPSWVELGQVTFTSNARIEVTIPSSSASAYFDEFGGLCSDPVESACIKVYAISPGDFGSLSVNTTLVAQTTQQRESTLLLLNNSTAPIHIVSVYVSGTNGVYGNTTGPSPPLLDNGAGIWVGGGSLVPVQLGLGSASECGAGSSSPNSMKCFVWTTDQRYVVTVTTDSGLVFTGTFLAP